MSGFGETEARFFTAPRLYLLGLRRVTRGRLIAAALASAFAAPAMAGEPPAAGPPGLWLELPRMPADTGKPLIPMPQAASRDDSAGCVPALPCGARLLGTVRKKGAVELQVPALRW